MKSHICVPFFIVSSLWAICQSDNIESNGVKDNKLEGEVKIRKIRSYLNYASQKHIGSILNNGYSSVSDNQLSRLNSSIFDVGFDDGNPDVHGDIKRPCQAYDTFCIRKFFSEHSKCKISGRAIPDPLFRAQGGTSFASNNMSETLTTPTYSGLSNGRVAEFYINTVTDNLVIAVTFDSVFKFTNNTYFKYYLRGREPIITRDTSNILFGALTITVTIPNIKDLRLDRSEIYTYGDGRLFGFGVGPLIGVSTDPEVVTMFAAFFTNVQNEYQEEMAYQGDFMILSYLQYNICDFGLEVL